MKKLSCMFLVSVLLMGCSISQDESDENTGSEDVVYEFTESEALISYDQLTELYQSGQSITLKNEKGQFTVTNEALKKVIEENRWGEFYDLNQVMDEQMIDSTKALVLFNEMNITAVTEDGYEAKANNLMMHPERTVHFKNDTLELEKGDHVQFYADIQPMLFEKGYSDLTVYDVKEIERDHLDMPHSCSDNVMIPTKLKYAESESIEIYLDEESKTIPLYALDLSDSLVKKVILHWGDKNFVYTSGMQEEEYPKGLSGKDIYLPLVFENQHLGKSEEVYLADCAVNEIVSDGFNGEMMNKWPFDKRSVHVPVINDELFNGGYARVIYQIVDGKPFFLEADYLGGLGAAAKPVIYLYPQSTTKVDVTLEYDGFLEVTYPKYQNGWSVLAHPDGTLINLADNQEYSYLFWEGKDSIQYDMSKGFVVKREDTLTFLQDVLAEMGLLPKEYNEMIVYWLPLLLENEYNLITFQNEAYTKHARLNIDPEPDSILRVFMVYQGLVEPFEIEEPEITPFIRKGFSVVEWGGSEVQ